MQKIGFINTLITLITGLALGLKKTGNYLVVKPPKLGTKLKLSVPVKKLKILLKRQVVDFYIS